MEPYALLNKYKAARGLMLMLLLFTILNCFLLMAFDTTFMFSLFLPQIALLLKDGLITVGASEPLVILGGVFLPIGLFTLCYSLSKKDWHWMLAGCVALAFDTFLMLFFWIFLMDFDPGIIMELMVEVICLVNVVIGVSSGIKLNNDFTEVASPEEVILRNNIKICDYDKNLAKQNKTSRLGLTLLAVVGYLFLFVIAIFTFRVYDSDSTSYLAMIGFIMLIGLVVFMAIVIKLSPFNSDKLYGFYKDKNEIYRITFNEAQLTEKLTDLKVVTEKLSYYKVTYLNEYNKTKKLVIPKCYSGIEKILPKK